MTQVGNTYSGFPFFWQHRQIEFRFLFKCIRSQIMGQRISRRTFLGRLSMAAVAASGLRAKYILGQPMTSVNRLATTSFTYWAILNQNVAATLKSYNDMLCYQELEKRTGVHINFQHISEMGAAQ